MYCMGSVGIVFVVFSCVSGVHLPRTVAYYIVMAGIISVNMYMHVAAMFGMH